MQVKKKFRFGVLIDSFLLKKWQVDSIQLLVKEQQAELCYFLLNRTETSSKAKKTSLGFRWIERRLRGRGPLELIDLREHFPSIPVQQLKSKKKKYATYLLQDAEEFVETASFDFLLRFGFGILKGKVLDIPTFGIWSFHHGDPSQYRGGPAGFWEIYQGTAINGAILQRLTSQLDKGVILKEGHFICIQHSYREHLYKLLNESASWPAAMLRSLINGQDFPKESISSNAPIYKAPSNGKVLLFLVKVFRNKLRFHYLQLFKAEKWNVGIVPMPIQQILENQISKIQWLDPAPNNSYRADPFAADEKTIYCEYFDYKNHKGYIEKYNTSSNSSELVLKGENHLSYPFSISHGGKQYLLPESYRDQQLVLHELKEGKVFRSIQLIEGSWIDPTLCYMNNTWWLFCTHQQAPNEKLYLFHSQNIEGPYIPHSLNPVLYDVRSARPAGTPFIYKGSWYRPAQNCSVTYGGSICLKRIDLLSTNEFKETLVKEVFAPSNSPYSKGIHTLSAFDNKTLIDGKHFYFDYRHFTYELKRKLKRILP
jgi:hypothetical protein